VRTTPKPLPAIHSPFNVGHAPIGIPVKSSNLKTVHYDGASQTLTISFHSGATYSYQHVPPILHEQLMSAPSKSGFLRDVISTRFIAVKRAPEPHA
jgi:hypothetical protein